MTRTHLKATRTARVRRNQVSEGGFTLVEVTIILMVLTVLSLILLPSIGNYLRDARLARARQDIGTIHQAILVFMRDTGEGVFRCLGKANRDTSSGEDYEPSNPDPFFTVGMLISDGDTPDEGDVDDAWLWRRPYDGHVVDTLANHLVQNTPGDEPSASYRTPEDLIAEVPSRTAAFASQQGFGARFAWRGPYVSAPVSSDPWGNRYAVNVLYLDPIADSATEDNAGYRYDVFVMSAGPDEEVDTAYEIDGVVPGDDDLVRVVSGASR